MLWQLTRSARLWLQVSTGLQFSIGPHTRVIGIAVLALLALLLAWRFGATRAGRRAIGMLLALRGPAFVLLAAALATLLISPPLWHPGSAARGVSTPAAAGAPDIVLISIDALAAEDAAVCGDGPTTMPQLRRLAALSSCFTRLYTGSNFTTPTTSTMETGTLPWTHLATQIAARVLPSVQDHSLAAQLRAAGYHTHFVTDNFLASPRHHGTWRGYDSHQYARSGLLRNRLREALTVWPDSQLPLLLDTVLSFIGAFDVYLHADTNPYVSGHVFGAVPALLAERPSFVWAHTMPPHTPYLPTPGFKHRLLPAGELDHWHQMMGENIPYSPNAQALVDKHRLRYRESMMGADDALGRLLDEL
ncbi:MAG: sulfatase-like hydrolase/transferase, partial [Rhodoglobus sp.]|nr:sulfatase-like hydrolase/transferase [Rhodoglobus sp.]